MISGFEERMADLERYIQERLPRRPEWMISIDEGSDDSMRVILANCEYSKAFLVAPDIDHITLSGLCNRVILDYYPIWKKLQ